MATNLDRAATVSRFVRLESVALSRASFSSDADPLGQAQELDAEIQYTTGYERRETAVIVTVRFRLVARPQEAAPAEEQPTVATLDADFVLVYRLPSDADPEADALEHFAQLNGTYNAWPYWRELVHTVSGRAGLAALVVPVFRPPIREIAEQEDAVEEVE